MSKPASIDGDVGPHLDIESGQVMKGLARHTFGLLLLGIVVFLWTAGNFMSSSILATDTYAKPFFMTYLNTSLFLLVLIPTAWRSIRQKHRDGTLRSTVKSIFSKNTLKEFLGRGANLEESIYSERQAFLNPNSDGLVSSTPAAVNAEVTDGYLGLIPTARLAFVFCILWFGANYFTVACLQYTAVASATILTSTSSVWTLLVGTISGTEKFTWRKLCGVLASLVGIILISRMDLVSSDTDEPETENPSKIGLADAYLAIRAVIEFPDKTIGEVALGDGMALLSAVIYGFYTIKLKRSTLQAYPLELHMPTFFGLVGFFNLILVFPLFIVLHFTGIETFELPPSKQIWAIMIVNGLSSMGSDVLWAYAMVFTSPLVVTVGLSMTIPLSLVGEMFIQGRYEGWMYWLGAMVVVGSFVFVEREEVKEEKEIEEEFARRSLEASMILGTATSGSCSTSASMNASATAGPSHTVDYGGCQSQDK